MATSIATGEHTATILSSPHHRRYRGLWVLCQRSWAEKEMTREATRATEDQAGRSAAGVGGRGAEVAHINIVTLRFS